MSICAYHACRSFAVSELVVLKVQRKRKGRKACTRKKSKEVKKSLGVVKDEKWGRRRVWGRCSGGHDDRERRGGEVGVTKVLVIAYAAFYGKGIMWWPVSGYIREPGC